MKHRIQHLLLLCLIGIMMFCETAFARDAIPFEDEDLRSVHVNVQYEGSFTERVELYFDGVQRSALWYDESMANNGYDKTIQVEAGTYQFMVLSSTDLEKEYVYTYPETIDTSKENEITITVTQQENADEGLYSGHADGSHDHSIFEETVIEPMVYDFTDGKESGSIMIQAKNYGAVKSLQYTLVGPERTYEILLDRDHLFEAEVKLPVGEYYESSDLSIELSDAASVREEVSFLWAHKNNPAFWGNYYQVTTGTPIQINDLIINMVSGSEHTELNSNVLFADSNTKNLVEAQQQHNQEQLESAFPELYESEAETETIATAQEVDENPLNIAHLLFIIGGMIAGCIVILAIIYLVRRRYKE